MFTEEGEYSRGKIMSDPDEDGPTMTIKLIDYELTEPSMSRAKIFPYNKDFIGPKWVSCHTSPFRKHFDM